MEINFRLFRLREGIKGDNFKEVDIQAELADALYDKGAGIACHALALKIYNSEDGIVSLSPQELKLLIDFAEQMMTPKFIDSLRAYDTTDSH
jgi:hypothetical protein